MTAPTAADWCDDADEVLWFARELDKAGAFSETSDVVEYFAAPHDWSPEHARWVALDRPDFGRDTRGEWDVVLDTVSVSGEAEELIAFGELKLHRSAERGAVRELLAAGLIEEDRDVPEYVRGTFYRISKAGRLWVSK